MDSSGAGNSSIADAAGDAARSLLRRAGRSEGAARREQRARLLAQLDSPQRLRECTEAQLPEVARALRELLLGSVSTSGGHLASNLGTVELTVALHYVYDTPRDVLVWDVGHQAYAHKALTGRRQELERMRQRGGPSGFLRRDESPFDSFGAGHSSTSISAALGFALAATHSGDARRAVAIIGDGALTAGLAFEALDHAGATGADLLVVLNDNGMSISTNVGALNESLRHDATADAAARGVAAGQRIRATAATPSTVSSRASALPAADRWMGTTFRRCCARCDASAHNRGRSCCTS